MRDLFSERRNVLLFYLLSGVMSCAFIVSNWYYFWTKYMTYGQLGWVDALGFGFGLLLEIPSGAIADLFGKRRTIIFGMIAGSLGACVLTFSGSLMGILIGWLIMQFCYAFYSGAAEALIYDSLRDMGREKDYEKIATNSTAIGSYVGAATIFVGGFLYTIDFKLPGTLWAIGFIIGALSAFFLIEPKIDTIKFSFKKYLSQLVVGFKELTHSELRKYIGLFFVLVGAYYMYAWGIVRPAIATSFGFYSEAQAIILPALTLIGALAVKAIPAFRKRLSDFTGLTVLAIFMGVGFVSAAWFNNYLGLISMFLIAITGMLCSPWISIVVNKRISPENRATTLSTMALVTKIPYVLLAVIVGEMVQNNQLAKFDIYTGATILLIAVISFLTFAVFKKNQVTRS